MEQNLQGKRVAVLMTDGVEQVEYTRPRAFLEDRGAHVTLVSPKRAGEQVQASQQSERGDTFMVELSAADANAGDYDGLLLPGGEANPAALRLSPEAIAFVRGFGDANKPIAAICHGPLTLIDAGLARSRHLTSWPSLQDELCQAGAEWTDDEVVVDDRLVTSRKPDDIPAFNDAFMKELIVSGTLDTGVSS
jgi:protease I